MVKSSSAINISLGMFSAEEYKDLVNVWNAAYPMYPAKPEEIKRDDQARAEHIIFKRYMVNLAGETIGFGAFLNSARAFHSQKFLLTPVIVPQHHGKGYGKTLYHFLMQELKVYNPIELIGWSREDFNRPMRFLKDRGFQEAMRSFESRLNVDAFDTQPYDELETELKTQGIKIKTAAELTNDPDFHQKVYELHTTLDLDVPTVGEYTKPSFETFAKNHWLDENYIPEAYLIAIHNAQYIGMNENFRSARVKERLKIGLTGVLRDYRRKGVAFAMKIKAIKIAKELAAKELSTWNASNNKGMLAINEALGFEKQPASIDFVKKI